MAGATAADLLNLLGSVWRSVFRDDSGQLHAYLAGLAEAEEDVDITRQQAIDVVSRLTTPLRRKKRWHRLVLRESQRNAGELAAYLYGADGLAFGNQISYGQAEALSVSRFALPSSLVRADFIVESLLDPAVILADGIDYTINVDGGFIEFETNPFDNVKIPQRGPYTDGSTIEREIELWLFRPEYDEDLIYKHWGYVAQLVGASTEGYKAAVNAAIDTAVEGSSALRLYQFVAAVCDVPIARGSETVEAVFTDDAGLVIATDTQVYRYHADASPVVAVGDQLTPGQALVDVVEFSRFNGGPLPDGLSGLTVDKGMFGSDTFGSLFFPNETVDTSVTVDDAGYTDWRFPVEGWPADVTWLFDTLQERGRAAEQTLAMLVDRRTNKVGQPPASQLPATVNPAEFVAENVLRNNALLLRIDVDRIGQNSLPLSYLRRLPQMLPPHAAIILDITAPTAVSYVEAEYASDSLDSFYAADVVSDTLDPEALAEDVASCRYIDGVCL